MSIVGIPLRLPALGAKTYVYGALSRHAPLTGIVGDRIYPGTLPDMTATPAVCYQQISVVRHNDLSGTGLMEESRFQLDIWGRSVRDVERTAAAVNAAMAAAGIANVLDRGDTDYEPDTRLHRLSLDYIVFHSVAQ